MRFGFCKNSQKILIKKLNSKFEHSASTHPFHNSSQSQLALIALTNTPRVRTIVLKQTNDNIQHLLAKRKQTL